MNMATIRSSVLIFACLLSLVSAKCSVSIRAYGASQPEVVTEGYVKLNGVAVWEAGWFSSKPNIRGVSLMTIDPLACTVLSPTQTFDTFADDAAAGNLNAFLDGVPDGNVIVGVTGDEASSRLGGSLDKLSSYGVDVRDVQYRGNFAFVAEKGNSAKTKFVKQLTSSPPYSSDLNVDFPSYELNITVDDEISELYFDGVLYTGPLPNRAIFNAKDQVNLKTTPLLIAVKAKDAGGLYGVLAEDSENHKTDSSWKCTDIFYTDWALKSYDDSAWPAAVTKGTSGDRRRPTPNIALTTTYIWSPVYNSVTKTCYCRLKIPGAKCSVSVRAYGASQSQVPTEGYVKLNGVAVWEAGWFSSKPNIRGVSLMTIDPLTCTVLSPTQTFDTFADDAAAGNLNAFLDGVPDGNVIVGVTGDEPQNKLGASLDKLSSYGVDVKDVQFRGNFAFVAQKGSPAKTQFTKELTSSPPYSSDLNVNVQGGLLAADVTIDLINKTP